MATKSAKLAIDLKLLDDVGAESVVRLLESLTLSGFKAWKLDRIQLAAAASDQAVSFTAALAIVVFSHDNPFKLRVAAGETLLTNLRAYLVWCDDKDDAARSTSVLLSGNGTNVADVEVWVIEKP